MALRRARLSRSAAASPATASAAPWRSLGERIPLQVHEVPSGTRILDWTVPKEWNLKSASIRGPRGEVIADVADHNLHHRVLQRAGAGDARARGAPPPPPQPAGAARLDPLPDLVLPGALGVLPAHRVLESLRPGRYQVSIDATLEDGALTYGECFLPATAPSAGRRRGAVLGSRLPSVARQRQPVGARGVHGARRDAPGAAAPALRLPVRVRAGHDRRHRLVGAERRRPRPHRRRAGRRQPRRRRRRSTTSAAGAATAEIDRAAAVVLRDRGGEHAIEDFVPSATTSGSTARPASISRWAC